MTRPGGEAALANVRPLRPIRVLLATADIRYLRVARFLLRRAGFAVESCSADGVLAGVSDVRPHVVVLDDSAGVARTLRLRSALVAGHADVAVVLVSDRKGTRRDSPRIVSKWDGGDLLALEIERAYLGLGSDGGLLPGTD